MISRLIKKARPLYQLEDGYNLSKKFCDVFQNKFKIASVSSLSQSERTQVSYATFYQLPTTSGRKILLNSYYSS